MPPAGDHPPPTWLKAFPRHSSLPPLPLLPLLLPLLQLLVLLPVNWEVLNVAIYLGSSRSSLLEAFKSITFRPFLPKRYERWSWWRKCNFERLVQTWLRVKTSGTFFCMITTPLVWFKVFGFSPGRSGFERYSLNRVVSSTHQTSPGPPATGFWQTNS